MNRFLKRLSQEDFWESQDENQNDGDDDVDGRVHITGQQGALSNMQRPAEAAKFLLGILEVEVLFALGSWEFAPDHGRIVMEYLGRQCDLYCILS